MKTPTKTSSCEAVTFSIFSCFLHIQPAVFQALSSPQQSRHPERSASQICRKQRALWRGVEGPRRCLLADALHSFPATKMMREIKKVTTSERSASQIYRETQRLVVRSRRNPGGAYLTHAARSFSTIEAREQDLLRYALDDHGYIFSCTVIIFDPQDCARSLNSGLLPTRSSYIWPFRLQRLRSFARRLYIRC